MYINVKNDYFIRINYKSNIKNKQLDSNSVFNTKKERNLNYQTHVYSKYSYFKIYLFLSALNINYIQKNGNLYFSKIS